MKDILEYTKEEFESLSTSELEQLYTRAEQQESLYNTRQLVEKLAINSLYGALGNRWFPLFNQDIARAITGNGRYFISKLANYIDDRLQELLPQPEPYIIYGDTDSVYYQIAPFMDKVKDLDVQEQADYADRFEQQIIQPVIEQCIIDFSKELHAYNKDVIGAEREIIADKGVFVAKKKYFARVIDSEGVRYSKPKTKVMGLEIIKSSTPIFSQKYLKESIELILDSDENDIRNWLDNDIKPMYTEALLGNIASVSGVSNLKYRMDSINYRPDLELTKEDKNGKVIKIAVPIGARAAIMHNHYIETNNLEGEFTKIDEGDKTKRLYLIEPNPLKSNIIAFTDDRFIEKFKDYIDYDTNFEKGFLKPLEIMTNALKWDLRQATDVLDEW